MEEKHIKLSHDFIESTSALSYEKIGRLAIGMLRYARDDDVPSFTSNERFLSPFCKAQIDRDRDDCDEEEEYG